MEKDEILYINRIIYNFSQTTYPFITKIIEAITSGDSPCPASLQRSYLVPRNNQYPSFRERINSEKDNEGAAYVDAFAEIRGERND